MESIFKSYMGLMLMVLLMCIGLGIIGVSIDARNADDFANDCVMRIQASNYNSAVVADCIAKANSMNYELNVDITSIDEGYKSAQGQIELKYRVKIPILGIDTKKTINQSLC